MSRVLRCTTLLFLLGLAMTARANWDKKWDRIQVHAHLLDSGAVEVTERMTAILEGDMDSLERPLSAAPDQQIVLRRLVREDSDGEIVLADGDRRERDQFDFTNGVLTWGIRPPDGEWRGETIVCRVEYELRNALVPAWDIPMSGERFGSWGDFRDFPGRMRAAFTSWREAGGKVGKRYRYEHEVRFPPFPATGPRETNYTLKYDKAWRMVFPEREIGRGAEEFYRTSALFEFLPSGVPAEVGLWRPLARVGLLLLVALAISVLSALWFLAERPIRGLWRERLNRAWFTETIVPVLPEALAWFGDHPVRAHFERFLARMQQLGALTITTMPDADPEAAPRVMLRRQRVPPTLAPYEREVIDRLFPKGDESGTEVLAQHYRKSGFDPGGVLAEAVSHQLAVENPPTPLVWRLLGKTVRLGFAAGAGFILFAAISGGHDWRLAMNILIGALILGMVPVVMRTLPPGKRAALSIYLPVVLAALIFLALFTLQFATHLPLTVWSSAGAALLALGVIVAFFMLLRTEEAVPLARSKRDAALAARFGARQLRRARPALSDAWMPHLFALGLAPQIVRWRNRPRDPAMAAGMQPGDFAPFTAPPPGKPDDDWEDALTVCEEEKAP